LTGRVPWFSPLGLFGLFGVQFFFLAPLLHVYLDYFMSYTVGPPDWRPWLGAMAILNLFGLLAFHGGRRLLPASAGPASAPPWTLNPAIFFPLGAVILGLSLAFQAWIYARFGGIAGFVGAYQLGQITGNSPFEGWGRLMMVAELFPVVAFMMVAAHVKLTGRHLSLLGSRHCSSSFSAFACISAACAGAAATRSGWCSGRSWSRTCGCARCPSARWRPARSRWRASCMSMACTKASAAARGLVQVLDGRLTFARLDHQGIVEIEE
jgi:hypothetical protein